jgi:Asp-tRNA(Asn)/Glu-tRNA(Gln) amidotransferase A subunit family amidase
MTFEIGFVLIVVAIAIILFATDKLRVDVIAVLVLLVLALSGIVTPATGIAAPEIKKGALPDGESDPTTTLEIMRFAAPANLTGLPAISFPVGYTRKGLPIGMQVMGRAWDEVNLLRMALVAEQVVERREPQVYYNLLG